MAFVGVTVSEITSNAELALFVDSRSYVLKGGSVAVLGRDILLRYYGGSSDQRVKGMVTVSTTIPCQ